MIYKEIRQSLRGKTFGLLTMGLLALPLLIIFIGTFAMAKGAKESGAGCFIALIVSFSIYIFGMLISQSKKSSDETHTVSFELFSLGGMKPEKVIRGKLATLMLYYIFALSCILPTMIASYFLGGLDIYMVLTTVATSLIIAVPLFMLVIIFSYTNFSFGKKKKKKSSSIIFRIIAFIFFINIISPLVRFLFMGRLLHHMGGSSTSSIYSSLPALIIFGTLLYTAICFFLFYIACHQLCGKINSKLMEIRLFGTLCAILSVTLLPPSFQTTVTIFFYTALIMYLLGIQYKNNNLPTGLRPKNRFLQISNKIFGGGNQTNQRFLFFSQILYCTFLFALISLSTPSKFFIGNSKPFLYFFQIPLWTAFPFSLAMKVKYFQKNNKNFKKLLVVLWILLSVLFAIYLSGELSFIYQHKTPQANFIIPFLAPFLVHSHLNTSLGANIIAAAIGIIMQLVFLFKKEAKE